VTAPATIDVASRVRPAAGRDDPAETFHEASRLAPATIGAQLAGSARLGSDPLLLATARRASRRHTHRPAVVLGRQRLPRVRLAAALGRRRSSISGSGSLRLRDVSTLLAAGYGSYATPLGRRRPVPSAGALYPLELYLVALDVDGLAAGVHHYDPYRHLLEHLDARDVSVDMAAAVYEPAPACRAAAALVTTGVFPRAQFKYGQRGYRFVLLEAGHVAQNVLLAAAALRLQALPYGGFYDRRIDELVGADGVDECSVHMIFLGGRR
jgi:SagB-type dehydrogenase family enzyme